MSANLNIYSCYLQQKYVICEGQTPLHSSFFLASVLLHANWEMAGDQQILVKVQTSSTEGRREGGTRDGGSKNEKTPK